MCNRLHEDSEPIPEKGTGWKLFGPDRLSWCLARKYLGRDKKGWVTWSKSRFDEGGFCFFLDKVEAVRVLCACRTDDNNLFPIEYEGGLGTHEEPSMLGTKHRPPKVALCKRFRIKETIK